ncbi:uncharacterized protein PGTG_22006 [Puccinia graminis f. sp. tritici CRL 75-36-700-3]|uniref:Uncharacterized protein n=1 Tax=Puccinia graminis f. sp. tritici (strain CRL 75-36-700-3 / race SCCL) TaxID=418459 RepID=H6QT53_PUCGT|nr:uncharacterized protein PGTG_22006 [Puccinia graminis f. sp. tritici CRL 75-36-700-3]EHS64007.1 hypothetical protein PGTG_22006 [Puccinia graminis f. sp. tritici CRL 75-36-700-3]
MQFFKAAILLVSSIGFKVALGCEPSFDPGCIEKLPFGNANSRVIPAACSNYARESRVCCPAGLLKVRIVTRADLAVRGCIVE